MSNVNRSDVYARGEKGPEWFNDFLNRIASGSYETASVQDILSAIYNKRSETVDSVVQDYREKVGLDLIRSTDESDENVKQSSRKEDEKISQAFRPLSIRHAAAEEESIVDKIKSDPDLESALDSLCKHSGGNKTIQSLINYLRDRLGNDVSFSDNQLVQYLEDKKNQFKENAEKENSEYVGLVGITEDSADNREDDLADYIKNDGAK